MKRYKLIISALVAVLASLGFMGCVPSYFSEEYEKQIVTAGEEQIRAFLDRKGIDYEIDEVKMMIGTVPGEMGSYGSPWAEGEFISNNQHYLVAIDTQNGDAYWDYNLHFVNEALHDLMEEGLKSCGFEEEFAVYDFLASIDVKACDVPTTQEDMPTADVEISLYRLLPASVDAQNASEYAKQYVSGKDERRYSVDLCFSSMTLDAYNALFFENVSAMYPYMTYLGMLNVKDSSLHTLMTEGVLPEDYRLSLSEDYRWYGSSLTYVRYNVASEGDLNVIYADMVSQDGNDQLFSSPLSRDEKHDNVYYLDEPGYETAYLFMNTKPKYDKLVTYFYKHRTNKYKKSSVSELKGFPDGLYSYHKVDELDYDEGGYAFSLKEKIVLK